MEYVFVESSGLADPSNIGEFLEAVEIVKGKGMTIVVPFV